MNQQAQTQVNIAPAPKLSSIAAQGVSLQRKCACGGSAGLSGECEGCQEKRLTINRYSTDRRAPSGLLPSPAGPAGSTSLSDSGAVARFGAGHHFGQLRVVAPLPVGTTGDGAVSQPGDRSEEEADRAAEQVMRASSVPGAAASGVEGNQPSADLSRTQPLIQRQVDEEVAAAPDVAPTPDPADTATTEETAPAGLIVEDEAGEIGPEQMRKSEFLDELRAAVCAAADAELAAAGRSTEGCPYIERAFERYRALSGVQLERGLRRYAPEAAGATAARDYIPIASDRVRRAVAVWATTGKITGAPEEEMAASSEASPSKVSEGAASTSSNIQFKGQDGGAREAGNPAAIQAQLGSGRSLDGRVKSRMESAFGYDFSRVRVHTDAKAAELSSGLRARAFTIGSDVAFGAGEYRPETPIGDALIAHELAHVVQQGGAHTSVAPKRTNDAAYDGLEEDADASAAGAVVSLWSKARGGLAKIAANAMPRLKSGLRLQRCKDYAFCLKSGSFKEAYSVKVDNDDGYQANQEIKFEGLNTGNEGDKECSCDCGVYRHWVKGYYRRGSPTADKEFAVDSCGNVLVMNEDKFTQEYTNCIGDNDPDACKWSYTDKPQWSGLTGKYLELHWVFQHEVWDKCQKRSIVTGEKTLDLAGDKAPRNVKWK